MGPVFVIRYPRRIFSSFQPLIHLADPWTGKVERIASIITFYDVISSSVPAERIALGGAISFVLQARAIARQAKRIHFN